MIDLLAAEWLKLRTIRLLAGMIAAAVAVSAAAVAGAVLSADMATLEAAGSVRRVLPVTGAGAIFVLVLGVVISAGEYRHGTAADTYLTTPRRGEVLSAKLAVAAAVGLGAGIVVAVASLALATLLYRVEGATFPFDDGETWLILGGALLYTTLFAAIGVAFGELVRNQVLAVGAALAWFAIIEHTLVNLLPDIGRWLPLAAGQAVVRTHIDGLLSPLGGAAVLAAYGAGIAMVGLRVAVTRDV